MGEDMSLYERFKAEAVLSDETDFVKIYGLLAHGKEYKVVITKKRANRYTVIHCESNHVAWEQVPQFPRLTGRNYGDKVPIYKTIPEKSCVTLFVVRGKPSGFVGLDDGLYRCADGLDERYITVMSYKRFERL